MRLIVACSLIVWFALVAALGAAGAFQRPPTAPPLPLLLGAITPLALFAAAWRGSGAFRAFVLGANVVLLTMLQAWRMIGLDFLALHAHGILPGLFAWVAGLGDIAVAATAPWVALALIRRPEFALGRGFAAWNILGVLDLVVAVSLGALGSGFVPGFAGEVTTAPMSRMPLVLIPALLVPLFTMCHIAALLQARARAGERATAQRAGGDGPRRLMERTAA